MGNALACLMVESLLRVANAIVVASATRAGDSNATSFFCFRLTPAQTPGSSCAAPRSRSAHRGAIIAAHSNQCFGSSYCCAVGSISMGASCWLSMARGSRRSTTRTAIHAQLAREVPARGGRAPGRISQAARRGGCRGRRNRRRRADVLETFPPCQPPCESAQAANRKKPIRWLAKGNLLRSPFVGVSKAMVEILPWRSLRLSHNSRSEDVPNRSINSDCCSSVLAQKSANSSECRSASSAATSRMTKLGSLIFGLAHSRCRGIVTRVATARPLRRMRGAFRRALHAFKLLLGNDVGGVWCAGR
jgi:hypothetical protein